jgi:hypothetical protein
MEDLTTDADKVMEMVIEAGINHIDIAHPTVRQRCKSA